MRPGDRRTGEPDRGGAAPARDLEQLPRARRHEHQWRLRRALRAEHRSRNGNDTLGEGKIAGEECLAYADDGTGRRNVTMMVQIPASFDARHACIVAGPSSGSRGVYGAIGTTGEWGLKRGCAVAYTDKGTGNGAHDLQNDTVNLHRWRAHRRERRRQEVELHGAADGRGARGVQRRDARPLRLQARPLGAQPRAGLGRARAGVDPLRVRHPQRALRPPEPARQGRAPDDHEAQHDRHRLERLERRRRLARRGRARRRPPDRRRGGRRSRRSQPRVNRHLTDQARRHGDPQLRQGALRLHHAREPVPAVRRARAGERRRAGGLLRRSRRAHRLAAMR